MRGGQPGHAQGEGLGSTRFVSQLVFFCFRACTSELTSMKTGLISPLGIVSSLLQALLLPFHFYGGLCGILRCHNRIDAGVWGRCSALLGVVAVVNSIYV